jgi:hypothetical protein
MTELNLPRVEDLDLHMPRHPRTGELLLPVFTTKRGRTMWPVLGAEDDAPGEDDLTDDADEEDDESDDDGDDDDSGDDDDKDSAKSKKKSSKKDDDEDDGAVPQWKYDKMERRMKAADRRSTQAEAKVKDLETQLAGKVDPKDVDKATREENDKLKPQVTKLVEQNKNLMLQVAFLKANDIQWQDPEAALRLADLSDVDIDEETGQVDARALKAALKDLARNKKYLVKPKGGDDEEKDDTKGTGGTPKLNGRRKGTKDTPDAAALKKRFPALNRQ